MLKPYQGRIVLRAGEEHTEDCSQDSWVLRKALCSAPRQGAGSVMLDGLGRIQLCHVFTVDLYQGLYPSSP